MDNKIEIYENTLLKLLVRRGSDVDRQNVILSQGELGYTTDTNRLFVGDGVNFGGTIVGNKFAGSRTDVTTFTNVVSGDYAFDTDGNQLYIFNGGSPSNIANWTSIGGVYTAGNGSIIVSPSTNTITVGTLSANTFDDDAVGNSIVIDGAGRVALNTSQIQTNSIIPYSSVNLQLPSSLSINSVNYSWPSYIAPSSFLKTDISGNLTWSDASSPVSVFVAGETSQIPVGSIMPFVSSANAPFGWLLCNGQQVAGSAYRELSAVIGTTYGGNTTNFNVPNFINKALYGVQNNPAGSTTYSVATGSNSQLSAAGTLYIIKAKPDSLVSSTFTVNNGLTSTVNGIDRTSTAVSPLTGSINIGLGSVIESQEIEGGTSFTVDTYGRVVDVATVTSHPAGEITNVGTYNTPAYNTFSPISFLQTPAVIYTGTAPSALRFTLSAYPSLTNSSGVSLSVGVPQNAKNLIVDCDISKNNPRTGSIDRYIVSAPNINLLGALSSVTVATTEYVIAASRAAGSGDNIRSSSQAFIPLSANSVGLLQCGIRFTSSSGDAITLRVIGYTL
jgi:microcystin-dependent protein